MKLIEYAPNKSFDLIIDSLDLSVSSPSCIYIIPDIPLIRQIEYRYSSAGVWSDCLYTFAKLSALSNLKSGHLSTHISKLGRLMVMQEVLDELNVQLENLGAYSGISGFQDSLLGLLAELKHMGLGPGDIYELAVDSGSSSLGQKLKDISRIFKLYQDKLTSFNMSDDIDQLHKLVSLIRNGQLDDFLYGLETVAVFGFYDFTQSQIDVLKSLDEKIPDVLVLMPMFNNLDKLEHRVRSKFSSEAVIPVEELTHNTKEDYPETEIRTYPLINDEIDAVFKEIKMLVLEEEYDFEDIAVIFRSIGNYATRIINAADKYGVPVSINDSFNLRTSLFGIFINDLISLVVSNYKREQLLRVLKNPLTALYLKNKDLHEVISKIDELSADTYKTFQGLDNWKGFFEKLINDRNGEMPAELLRRINYLMNNISTAFKARSASKLISGICAILDMIEIREISNYLLSEKRLTRSCWDAFNSFIREMRFISDKFDRRFDNLGGFLSFINELMMEKTYSHSTLTESKKIEVLQGLQIRGVKYPVVFLVNTDEDSFPSPHVKDPVLKTQERKEINQLIGKQIFPEDYIHYEKEEHLFNLITNVAGEKLYVSCSRLDNDYNEKNRSYFIDTVQDAVMTEVGFGDLYSGSSVYSPADLMTIYFLSSHNGYENADIKKYIKNKNGMDLLGIINTGISAENSRSRLNGEYSSWEGIVEQGLRDTKINFRPTELEQYGTCPFRYFSDYLLNLREERRVEDRIEPMDLGRMYHEILRDLFLLKLGDLLTTERISELTPQAALTKYSELMDGDRYDSYFSHLSGQVKQLEKKRILGYTLPSFIEYEIERIMQKKEFIPYMFEKDVSIDEDNYSINGKIDRVDRDLNGNVIVYDYKAGNVDGRKYYDFRNLQLPIYLLALKDKGLKPYGGYYLSVKKAKENGKEGSEKLELEYAGERMISYIRYIKRGVFPPVVADKEINFLEKDNLLEYSFGMGGTCTYCGYSDLCRVKNGVKRRGD